MLILFSFSLSFFAMGFNVMVIYDTLPIMFSGSSHKSDACVWLPTQSQRRPIRYLVSKWLVCTECGARRFSIDQQ